MGVTCLCPGPVATEIGDAMNFFSENIDIHGAGEAFAMMDAADVGVMVRKAIQDDRFMVPTHAAATREAVTARAHDTDAFEIGRASCRERVCQYVSISVVAVSLQKKNKKKNN